MIEFGKKISQFCLSTFSRQKRVLFEITLVIHKREKIHPDQPQRFYHIAHFEILAPLFFFPFNQPVSQTTMSTNNKTETTKVSAKGKTITLTTTPIIKPAGINGEKSPLTAVTDKLEAEANTAAKVLPPATDKKVVVLSDELKKKLKDTKDEVRKDADKTSPIGGVSDSESDSYEHDGTDGEENDDDE